MTAATSAFVTEGIYGRSSAFSVNDVSIARVTMRQVCQHVITRLASGVGGRLATANVDQLAQVRRDRELLPLLRDSEVIVADGAPLVWASRLCGTPLPERVAGSDLIWSLADAAAEAGERVFLLGGPPGVAERAAQVLAGKWPALGTVGWHCPPVGFEGDPDELARINDCLQAFGPSIVFCGLGFPKQEKLISQLHPRFPQSWFVSCGAALAFASGDLERAPRWIQSMGGEWLFRLSREPRRLAHRYLIRDVPYAIGLLAQAAARRPMGRANQAG